MARLIKANQSSAAGRRVFFQVIQSDGINPATDEADEQPQISIDGGGWADAGIGVLVAVGEGRYYAELAQSIVSVAGRWIETRYRGDNTAESPGESVQVVGFDPDDGLRLGLTALPGFAAGAEGGLVGADAGGFTPAAVYDIGAFLGLSALDTDYAQSILNVNLNGEVAAVHPAVAQTLLNNGVAHEDSASAAALFANEASSRSASILAKLTGITALRDWLRAVLRGDAPDATAAAEIGGTYDSTTDSQQAIRDRVNSRASQSSVDAIRGPGERSLDDLATPSDLPEASPWSAEQRDQLIADVGTIKTRTAQGVRVSIGSHVAASTEDAPELRLVQGESYLEGIGNAIRIELRDARLSASVTGDGTLPTLRIQATSGRDRPDAVELAGEIVSFDAETETLVLRFDMPAATSAGLRPGPDNRWEIDLALAGDVDHTLTPIADAPCVVAEQIA